MQKIITTILLLVSAFVLQAQGGGKERVPLRDKLVPHFGFSLEFVTLSETDVPTPGSIDYSFYTLGIGTYYVLAHKDDRMSVGLDPTLQFGLQGFTGALDWTVQAPVFLMGRFGAFATPYNSQSLGIGAGIGFVGSYLAERSRLDFNQLYFIPSLMFEVSINPRSGPLTARIHIPISKPVYNWESRIGITDRFAFSQLGLGLVYGF
jgi:hypothetical protein